MPDFSVVAQSPTFRAIVQENLLWRAFHDALFPALLFRAEATAEKWPTGDAHPGDSMVFTGVGLITPNAAPIRPRTDPDATTWSAEQWSAQLQQYGQSIDTDMPTSILAIGDLFLRNAHQLGMAAGQSINRAVRARLYNAAESGSTVIDGAQNSATLRVMRLAGLTRARRPDLTLGSPVQFQPVSTSNPLVVSIYSTPGTAALARTIVGFTPDTPGDEIGPGTITVVGGACNVSDRDYVLASNRTSIVRVGGGNAVDDIGSNDMFRLESVRTAVARLRLMNIPKHGDGYYHCHLDPTSHAQLFSDPEVQRLNTALPDYFMYKEMTIGTLMGCVFFENNEAPLPETVVGSGAAFTAADPIAAELYSNGTSGVRVHRPLFTGSGGLREYYVDQDQLVSDVGLNGKMAVPQVTNNGMEVNTDNIKLIFRAPQDKFQQLLTTSWRYMGDFPFRTDVASGDAAAYKRVCEVQHGE